MTTESPAPGIVYSDYLDCCAEQIMYPPSEWTFKQDPRYIRVLEHIQQFQARQYLEVMIQEFGWLIRDYPSQLREICELNDSLGKPLKAHHPELDVICSATNFQYMYHAMLVWKHIRSVGNFRIDFTELGGGYGGMSLFLHKLAPFFNGEVLSYSFVDLPEAVLLQHRYMKHLGYHCRPIDGSYLPALESIGRSQFFVSAFAFGEFERHIQDWYVEHLLPKCWGGWIAWNYSPLWPHQPPNPVYQFIEQPLTIVPETPRIMTDQVSFVYW